MASAGINCDKYKAHSVRSSSKANRCNVPIDSILQVAEWSNAKTFAQFYSKNVEGIKDICGYFQCAPFPRLQTGKVVWVLSFYP